MLICKITNSKHVTKLIDTYTNEYSGTTKNKVMLITWLDFGQVFFFYLISHVPHLTYYRTILALNDPQRESFSLNVFNNSKNKL